MKQLILFCLIVIYSQTLLSQSDWIQYGGHFIRDIETTDKYTWIATSNSAISIDNDTEEMKEYQSWNSEMKGYGVQSIANCPNGDVWFGMYRGGLNRYSDGQWSYYYDLQGDTISSPNELICDESNSIWFQSAGTPGIWTLEEMKLISVTDSINESIHRIAPYTEDSTFISNNKKIFLYRNGSIVNELASLPLQDYSVSSIVVSDRELYALIRDESAGTTAYNYLFKYYNNSWKEILNFENKSIRNLLATDYGLWFSYTLDNKQTIANYYNGSVNYYKLEDITDLLDLDTLRPNRKYLQSVDKEGKWWFSVYEGQEDPQVYSISGNEATAYNTIPSGPYSGSISNISKGCDGTMVLQSNRYADFFDGAEWHHFEMGNDTLWYDHAMTVDETTCDIWAVMENPYNHKKYLVKNNLLVQNQEILRNIEGLPTLKAKDGILYSLIRGDVPGYRPGLGILDGDVWEEHIEPFVNIEFPQQNSSIYDIMIASDGKVYCSTSSSGIIVYDGTQWEHFNETNSIVPNHSGWTYEDNDGYIWASHPDGVIKYDGNDWSFFEIPSVWYGIGGMIQDATGNYWLSSYKRGLLYWNGYDLITYNHQNSDLASDVIWDLLMDDNGKLWLNHTYATSVLDPGNLSSGNGLYGMTYFDAEMNGTFDASSDARLANQKILNVQDSTIAITSNNGTYAFYPKTISKEKTALKIIDSNFELTTDAELEIQYKGESMDSLDFGLWTDIEQDSLSIDITTGVVVCQQQIPIWVNFTNHSLEKTRGEVKVYFDESFSGLETIPAYKEKGDNYITWEFDNLKYGQSRKYILFVDAPAFEDIFTQPLPDSDDVVLDFKAELMTDNFNTSHTYSEIFRCSYDPNDKLTKAKGPSIREFSLLEDPLEFTVRFQNLGNYPAFNVVIKDTIDTNLDLSSFQLVSSSHVVETNIDRAGVVTFSFPNINLVPSKQNEALSQGYVKYLLDPNKSLNDPTEINNTAHIYFDLNKAIVTNTTKNILVKDLSSNADDFTVEENDKLIVFPNPSPKSFSIKYQNQSDDPIQKVEIIDNSGRRVDTYLNPNPLRTYKINQKGHYLIKVRTLKTHHIEQVIIIH